ncbi:hypothetical protein QE152_g12404 [Popillia japonica]|uniref:Uncharacterized protein n=1 Tax=Popillia japonica TaxID=7064 RepID=A0AAW1LRU9_POPJA
MTNCMKRTLWSSSSSKSSQSRSLLEMLEPCIYQTFIKSLRAKLKYRGLLYIFDQFLTIESVVCKRN